MITALYTDGGCIGRNASPFGVTWAFCAVDENDQLVHEESDTVLSPEGKKLTNNFSEMVAVIKALEYVGKEWSGTWYTDSDITRGRICENWALHNLPLNVVKRMFDVLDRTGEIKGVLVQGHPNKKELAAGIGNKHGYPVSRWNCRSDFLCRKEAEKFKLNS